MFFRIYLGEPITQYPTHFWISLEPGSPIHTITQHIIMYEGEHCIYFSINTIPYCSVWAGVARPGRVAPIIVPVKDFYNISI